MVIAEDRSDRSDRIHQVPRSVIHQPVDNVGEAWPSRVAARTMTKDAELLRDRGVYDAMTIAARTGDRAQIARLRCGVWLARLDAAALARRS